MLSLYLSMLDSTEANKRLTEIYTENKDWMLRFANSLLEDENQAKDAVHNVFLKVIERLRKLPDKASDITEMFLYVAVKNTCINISKENKRIEYVSADAIANISSDENVEENAVTKDTYAQLLDFINSLPEIYSDILVLHYVCDLPLKEIAKMTGIPLMTVKTRYKRGKEAIIKGFGGIK